MTLSLPRSLALLLVSGALLASAAARAEELGQFRAIEVRPDPKGKGLLVGLQYRSNWGSDERSKQLSDVDLALFCNHCQPDDIRQNKGAVFASVSIPGEGHKDVVIPFATLQQIGAKPGATVYLTGHWKKASPTHVWGFNYSGREVPLTIPAELAFPAKQNAALRSSHRAMTGAVPRWRPSAAPLPWMRR